MFAVLLKAKLDIESKVVNLQKKYIELLRNPILPVRFSITEENSFDAAEKLIEEKIIKIADIREQYISALRKFTEVKALLAEVKESAEKVESEIDWLFDALKLKVPEDLVKKTTEETETGAEAASSEQPEAKDSTYTFLTDEEEEEDFREDFSDKENSQSCAPKSDSDNYFSPNIQIRKSFKGNNTDCYTPAIKSSSKLSLFKR